MSGAQPNNGQLLTKFQSGLKEISEALHLLSSKEVDSAGAGKQMGVREEMLAKLTAQDLKIPRVKKQL